MTSALNEYQSPTVKLLDKSEASLRYTAPTLLEPAFVPFNVPESFVNVLGATAVQEYIPDVNADAAESHRLVPAVGVTLITVPFLVAFDQAKLGATCPSGPVVSVKPAVVEKVSYARGVGSQRLVGILRLSKLVVESIPNNAGYVPVELLSM